MQQVSSLCSGPTHGISPPHLAKPPMTPRIASAYDMLITNPTLRSRVLCNPRRVQQEKSRHLRTTKNTQRRHPYQIHNLSTSHHLAASARTLHSGYRCDRQYSILVSIAIFIHSHQYTVAVALRPYNPCNLQFTILLAVNVPQQMSSCR